MIGQKLTKLLKALTPEEFRRMRKICQSPIYTSNVDHLKCYELLRKYYPDFDSPKLKKETVFKKMWKGQTFDDWKLRNLFSEFTRLTEDYLLLLEKEDKLERKKQLTRIYGKRNLYDFFEKGTKNLLADLEGLPYRDKDYYLEKALLNEAWYAHPLKDKYDLKDRSLENGMDSLDQYFVYAKMKNGILLNSRQKILNKPYELRFMEVIEIEQQKGFLADNVILKLFRWSLDLGRTFQTIDFETYEQLLFDSLSQLRKDDQKMLFFHGLNYIIGQANRGVFKFNYKAFEWHKNGITYNLTFDEQRISTIHYSNSITYACKVNEFNWAFNFIQDYQQYLDMENRDFVINFNQAKWHYFQKEYERILPLFLGYKIPLVYEMPYRDLLIRTIFELFLKDYSYFGVLNNKIVAFENYLRANKKFSPQKMEPHKNQLKLILKLTRLLIENKDKTYIRNWLLAELKNSSPIHGEKWLLEKADDLMSK